MNIYYLVMADTISQQETEKFYVLEEDARDDAVCMTQARNPKDAHASIARITVQGPSAIKTLDDMVRLLNRDGYASHFKAIAVFSAGVLMSTANPRAVAPVAPAPDTAETITIYYVSVVLDGEGHDPDVVFYETETSARADAERMSATTQGVRGPTVTISRMALQGPAATVSLINLLNHEDYYDPADIISTYKEGKEVPG